MSEFHMETRARLLSAKAHKGQYDKNGDPYCFHPSAVASNVKMMGGSSEAVQAAYLHDVLEDTDYTAENLRDQGFSPRVIEMVEALSHKPYESRNDYLSRVIADGRETMLVKFADMLHNTLPERLERLPKADRKRAEEKYPPAMAVLASLLWPITW